MWFAAGPVFGLAVMCLMVGACGAPPTTRAPASAGDETVEVAALKSAYRLEGAGRAVLFVDVADAADQDLEDILARLSADLRLTVRRADEAARDDPDLPALTPYDPETGEVGIVLRLVRVAATKLGAYRADVTFARSGLDGGSLSLALVWQAGGWAVVETSRTSTARLARLID